jgi:multidrug efflux pump subunit AcrA (membrane-fusion protein)
MPTSFLRAGRPLLRAGLLVATIGLMPACAFAADEAEAPKGVTVTVIKASKACFSATVEVFGVIQPVEEISVRPERDGLKISQILVDAGATVTAGQQLARLSSSDGTEISLQSPVAGVVNAAPTIVGAQTATVGPALFRITARSEYELVGDVTAADQAKLRVNQPARIKIPGAGIIDGRVRRVSPTISPYTQLGEVRVLVTARQRLMVNASGRAQIKTGESCGVSIPLTALLYGSGGPVVQVVRRQRVETRRVEVGLMAAGQVEIREGLTDGDTVVARAGALLREGDPVRTIAAETVTQ